MRILLFAALWPEASGLVRAMDMKTYHGSLPYRQYQDREGEILLTISGVGPVAMAAAVGAVLALQGPGQAVLIGSAAGAPPSEVGRLYRIHRLVDADAGRSFYPDLIYPHACILPEAALCSRAGIWKGEELVGEGAGAGLMPEEPVTLFDMEGAAFFQAANIFLGPQQIHILKLVSDQGLAEGEKMSPQTLAARIDRALPRIQAYLKDLIREQEREEEESARRRSALPSEEESAAWARALACSASMESQLRQLLVYAGLAGRDWRKHLEEMKRKGRLPLSDRRQGKLLLQELTDWVMRDA